MAIPEFALYLTLLTLIAAAPTASPPPNCDVGKGGREMEVRIGAVLLEAMDKSEDTETILLIRKIADALPPPGCQ